MSAGCHHGAPSIKSVPEKRCNSLCRTTEAQEVSASHGLHEYRVTRFVQPSWKRLRPSVACYAKHERLRDPMHIQLLTQNRPAGVDRRPSRPVVVYCSSVTQNAAENIASHWCLLLVKVVSLFLMKLCRSTSSQVSNTVAGQSHEASEMGAELTQSHQHDVMPMML